MIVTLQISPAAERTVARHIDLAADAPQAMADAVFAAAVTGAEDVRAQLVQGRLPVQAQRPATGLAASLAGWWLDETAMVAALGVPANTPAAAYARILNDGGVIRPVNAKALAVPVSEEARLYNSPRDQANLTYIPSRNGKPPLLVEEINKRGGATGMQVHWLLLASVTIPAFGWFDRGVAAAEGVMVGAAEDVFGGYVERWN